MQHSLLLSLEHNFNKHKARCKMLIRFIGGRGGVFFFFDKTTHKIDEVHCDGIDLGGAHSSIDQVSDLLNLTSNNPQQYWQGGLSLGTRTP